MPGAAFVGGFLGSEVDVGELDDDLKFAEVFAEIDCSLGEEVGILLEARFPDLLENLHWWTERFGLRLDDRSVIFPDFHSVIPLVVILAFVLLWLFISVCPFL